MGISVIVTLFYDPEWIVILQRLGYDVRYMAGLSELRDAAVSAFPSVIYEDAATFLAGIEDVGEMRESHIPFNYNVILRELSEYEFIIKYMINREYDHGHDRTNEIYFSLISYWLEIIDTIHPEIIIAPYTPYTAREYVLYALAKVYRIRFLSFFRATVGYYLNIPFTDLSANTFPSVVDKYCELKSTQHPFWIQDYANQRMKKKSNAASILGEADMKLKETVEFNTLPILRNYFKDTRSHISGLPLVPAIKRIWFDVKNLPSVLDRVDDFALLKSIYDSLCVHPDYSQPYIFFPLHYQPEQTTCPFGEYSVYQYLPIEMVAASLPPGWLVYVKEHYVTFSPFHGGLKKRSQQYYERLAKIPNVRLIRTEVQSAELIDRAKAVATIAGSPGYEALLRGKPTLTFGTAWYNGCEGVFPVRTFFDCTEAIYKIKKGVEINPVDFLLFVQATEMAGAKVNFSFSMKGIGDTTITREETVANMVTLIRQWNTSAQ